MSYRDLPKPVERKLAMWLVQYNFPGWVLCVDRTGDVPDSEVYSVRLWRDARARKYHGRVKGPGRPTPGQAVLAALAKAEEEHWER